MAQSDLSTIKSITIQPGTEKTGEYLPLLPGQTVCTVKNEKGENCAGHVKQWYTAPPAVTQKAAAGNFIHRCQRCAAIYEGPPQQFLHPQGTK